MNQYLKIPRGIKVVDTNDKIIRATIEEIGKLYSSKLIGKFRSDYAKGKAYLSRKYGVSKSALKKLHKVKISTYGYKHINEQYGKYISVHISLVKEIFDNIIKCAKDENIDILSLVLEKSIYQYNSDSKYIVVFFEESLDCMESSLRDKDNFNIFNISDDAHTKLRTVYNELNSITEIIGG